MMRALIVPACAALALLACGDEGTSADVHHTLTFAAVAGGRAVTCGETYSLGDPAMAAEISDLRFYVHDVRLLTAAGVGVPLVLDDDGRWQDGAVALLDFEDKTGACTTGTTETHTEIGGTAPDGDYTGVAFTVGVPEALNHEDAATAGSPLNLSSLFWSWTGGYKFFRLDLATAAGGWHVHIGSTACTGGPDAAISCARPNRPEVRLTGVVPGRDTVAFDLAALLSDSDLGAGDAGCQSGDDEPDCAAIFPRLGLALDDAAAAPVQTVFVAAP
ncbi:MAG: metallo-mystery pair system four-Cys motif protein [Deltaproteobacteria bacterium HGW-Deltaproteobacteria-14]|jgi:uncharacterized repeat protein (TIGR04052 family)|nr:MAG: metallo-mystery pair system four-Cys motif protein [Deltaproteobacteria bacterium HGW-Deltaproteobacteria-14]